MKVIYNRFIPFKGYKAMNLFGIVFVRKGAKFDAYDYNHEKIHLSKCKRCCGFSTTCGMQSST